MQVVEWLNNVHRMVLDQVSDFCSGLFCSVTFSSVNMISLFFKSPFSAGNIAMLSII